MVIRDEAQTPRGRASASAKPWAIGDRQFELVRAEDGLTYLIRWWIVKTPWGGIALHKMSAPDVRKTLHDHPFSFVSVVLRGGYQEWRLDPQTMIVNEHDVRRVNVMRRDDAHTIYRLYRNPTWTLLFCGKHRRRWGFVERMDARARRWKWTDHEDFDSGHYVP